MMSRKALSQSKAVELLGEDLTSFENPLTVLASPAWRGIEGDIWCAKVGDNAAILKHYHPDIKFYVESEAAIATAKQAGDLGVGPGVLGRWDSDAIVAFENLGSPWRAGGLHDAVNSDTRSRVVEQKKAFQAGKALKNSASIFNEIETVYKIVKAEQITAHRDIDTFMELFRDANQKVSSLGKDSAPCHRDGNTANIMVDPVAGRVKLIDFDLAANCDPFEDIGCHLVEYFESDADARTGFEEWHGRFDEGLFQRSMLYGLADDMRWGLIGAIMAARSRRTSLEFSKYSAWRFLRLEMQAKRSDANNRVRMAT